MHGISHVYIGRRGGAIAARALAGSRRFAVAYARDGVLIYAALASPAPSAGDR